MSWQDDLRTNLDDRRRAHLFRRREVLDTPQSVDVTIGGDRYLNFCSNDYLGLANHPALAAAFSQGVRRWGVGAGASHLVSGHTSAHQELEEALAGWLGAERALLFSSGYAANLALGQVLVGRGDCFVQDKLNHASLIDAGRLSRATFKRYPHVDVAALERRLRAARGGKVLIATDGVFSMDGDLAPLVDLAAAAGRHGAMLAIDDAHGLGVLGDGGRGVMEHLGLEPRGCTVLMGTLGKAFGCHGAFIAGDSLIIETFVQSARTYIFTTAAPPAVAVAASAALEIVRQERWRRERLLDLVGAFRRAAVDMGLRLADSTTPIQPVIVGSAKSALAVSRRLREFGILIAAIRPPTVPEGTARLRITFCADHTDLHLDRLLSALRETSLGGTRGCGQDAGA